MSQTQNKTQLTETTGDLGTSNIKILPETEIWEKKIDLGEEKTFRFSLLMKERMVYAGTGADSSVESNEAATLFTPIAAEQKSKLDTRLNSYFCFPFVNDVWSSVTSASVVKSFATMCVFLFGEPSKMYAIYFVLAAICVATGISLKIKQKALDLSSANALFMQQIHMCTVIVVMNLVIQALISPKFFAEGAFIVKDVVVVWLALHNALTSLRFLVELGVPFPKSWVEKIRLIKAMIE